MSDLFIGLQNSLPDWLPLPFPRPFIDGLDMAKYYDQVVDIAEKNKGKTYVHRP